MKTQTSKRFYCRNQKKISLWKKGEKNKKQRQLCINKGNRIGRLYEENGLRTRDNSWGGEELRGNKKHKISLEALKRSETAENSRKLKGGGLA